MKHAKRSFTTNLNRLFGLVLCSVMSATQAALPPDFQNEKDLADITAYIKSDHEVLSALRVIDLAELTVYYGDNCRMQFARKTVKREVGWVGPAEPVEFKSKECVDDVVETDQATLPTDKIRRGVIVSAEADGVACYLQLKDETGKDYEELASFDLCKDESLLDKPSDFIYEQISVVAATCDDDKHCTDTEQVWFIAEVK